MNRLWRVLLVFGALISFGGTAQAQQARRIVLDAVDVKGKVQKPEITIFFSRQNINTEYNLELKQSFIPKIVESVDQKPF